MISLFKLTRAVAVCVALFPSLAQAGGMTLPARGARPLGRAGSFVAGADDGGALYYNPAGFADVNGVGLLLDAALVLQQVEYTRVDSGGNRQPTVKGEMGILPIPTLALSWKPKKVPWLTLNGGVWTPYLGLSKYPEEGPQRYSVANLDGSLVLVLQLGAAFRVHEHFWIGFGLQNMILKFRSQKTLSACPSQLDCAPEDPSFDSPTLIDATSGFTPSGVIGATVAYPKWRAGLSVQLPFWARADGTVKSRLPTNPMFVDATLVGEAVTLELILPLILRLGVEYRPLPTLRIELGFDYEAWSMQQNFKIQPHGIYIDNNPGIGKYYLPTLYENRALNDTYAVHLGGEYEALKNRLIVRAGWLLETSATPDSTLSVLAVDGLKNMIALGLGVKLGPVRLDFAYAHIFTGDRDVDYRQSKAYQVNPIQPGLQVGVGGGRYQIAHDILALGLDGRF